MDKATLREYQRIRRDQWELQNKYRRPLGKNMTRARQALRDAKLKTEFDSCANVRLRVEYQEDGCIDDLVGDMFNPKYDGLTNSQREREYKAFVARVNDEGVFGLTGEYFDGDDWQHAASCWGFIGGDWRDSGYESDIMHATLEAHAKHCEALARDAERERPDMYAGASA